MEFVFYFCLVLLVYAYFGYPLLIILLVTVRPKPVRKADIEPTVSFIFTAYNEAKHIRKKIENTLALDYPRDKLEIIIASDGSTDATPGVIEECAPKGITPLILAERNGKTFAQNRAVEMARGEIIFFSDATILYGRDVIKKMMRSFADPEVGCVTGKITFRDLDKNMTGRGLATRIDYERYLRSKLSDLYSMFGATGAIYAVRRKLCPTIPKHLVPDLVIPLKILEAGYRTVYEPEAEAIVDRVSTAETEFQRRSRIVLRGLRGLAYMKTLMNPFKHGLTALSLVSHRLVRWLAPIFLVLLFLSNAALIGSSFYRGLFVVQFGFYLSSVLAYTLERRKIHLRILSVPLYFCLLNCSAAVGIFRYVKGDLGGIWETVGR